MKLCTKCKTEQPLENFNRDSHTKDGLFYWCRECTKAKVRAAREKKIEHYRTVNRAWNERNIDKVREYNKAYHQRTYQPKGRGRNLRPLDEKGEARRAYQHEYYLRVSKPKREAARRERQMVTSEASA